VLRLTTAIALVLLASPALSQVQDGSNGEGTLFLTVFDPGRGETYNVDLGASILEFIINPVSVASFGNIRVPTELVDWMFASPDSSAILWDVGAVNLPLPPEADDYIGVLITARGAPAAPISSTTFLSLAWRMQSYVAGVNASIENNGGIVTSGPGYFGDPGTWNRNVGGALAGTTGMPLNVLVPIYAIIGDLITDPAANTYSVTQLTFLRLTLVPLPVPAVLLLSALVGFAAFAWRR